MVDRLTDPATLLAATGGDAWVRASLVGRALTAAWTGDAAACWLAGGERERQLCGHGPAPALAGLLATVAGELALPVRATLPRPVAGPLGVHGLALPAPTAWDFRWTTTPPPPVRGEEAVVLLAAGEQDDRDVAALLEASSPTASATPGDPAVRRWFGARGPDGALLAVAADTSRGGGVGHVSSVATRTDQRGRGLGAAVTAALTRRLLAEGCTLVTLGLYADNDIARRLYRRLGFHDDHPMASGTLRRRDDAASPAPYPASGGRASMPASAR